MKHYTEEEVNAMYEYDKMLFTELLEKFGLPYPTENVNNKSNKETNYYDNKRLNRLSSR